jgi:NitT/TauT family transport system permease protein
MAVGPQAPLPLVVRLGVPIAVAAAFLAIWWLAVVLSETVIFPSPLQVAEGTLQLAREGTLWNHIGASLFRVASGFLLAMAVGIPLGLFMGWKAMAYTALNPIVQVLRPISPIAWIPIAILWFGVGDVSAMFLIFIASFLPLTLAAMKAVHDIDPVHLSAARNFALPPRLMMREVLLPAILPQLLVGVRITVGIAWLVVVAAEMIAVNSGLGFLIIDARNAGNRYDLVIAGMVLIGLIGVFLDLLVRRVERRIAA